METFRSLVALLARRAAEQADDRAYIFVSDRGTEEAVLTFRQLHHSASALARRLTVAARPGDRAILVFPPGIEFMVAFFGCLIAGIIAVPMMMPRRNSARDASAAILANCTPTVALTNSAVALRGDLRARFAHEHIRWIEVDLAAADGETIELPEPAPDDIAFLQYTSGSTSAPKGVMVSHANLLANLEMIRLALGNTWQSTYVNWVPLYHDMGLILNALQALYIGATCVLMAPNAFMQRPLGWLRAISHYRAEVACSPNFGFDLCVSRYRADQMEGVDLSSLRIALNGAEPVHAETIERFIQTFAPHGFDPRAMYPAYGMAEATLLISGGRCDGGHVTRSLSRTALQAHAAEAPSGAEDTQIVVGCGRALTGERIAIVDANNRTRLPADRVGEIWVNGANIARAYWRNDEATREGLNAQIAGENGAWLRTGDLGFLDVTGELFVTGRIKDLIIIRGINHYPQDVERTVQSLDGALRENCGAAFSVPDETGEESLVIVQEIERTARHSIDTEAIRGRIREAVADNHELSARHIALIRPGTLPKTTSGKIQRKLARKLWLDGGFEQLG
ncbi:fatty acyl-AMP ligase [Bradyrhizobium sp. 4]|uniref:fatty acyl-AMP ligase n=1 Tax=unclassified Bradyrhizobium TaxID=2631580 RepID=UPI001FF822A6|nr:MULTISPECIES: fatty acyl-AMP ligase [unclassified Bradyrhizobium]MCK1399665.1 fatty acyl-AMP ligase [Bradyrhizobium sp. 39]MCK1747391.1 fatty acyl-AMP ligase [Bradyrhizobium sp. 135]UPJ33759.1 fatty acyl-AMP ligase [Bradyrhizobium sp. 4]